MEPVTLALTGDIYPTRPLNLLSQSVKQAISVLRDADIAIGNFEISLSDKGAPLEKLLAIRARPELEADLPEFCLDVVTVANNHSVDYGWEALSDSIGRLEKAGIRVVGAGPKLEDAMRPQIVEARGRRVGIIAFSCLLPAGQAASATRPGISPIHVQTAYEIDPGYQMEEPGDLSVVKVRTWARESDLAVAEAAVSALKSQCDVVVVSIHWGFGSGESLADYQLPLARKLIEAGADIIHGHHPHSIHAIGFYERKPILFSPNVFVGQQVFLDASDQVKAMWAEMSVDGYVARLTLAGNGDIGVEIVPTTLNADRLPVLATGEVFKRISERLTRLSVGQGAVVTEERGVLCVRPV